MKQPLKYIWMTPIHSGHSRRDCVALFRWGEWIEIYQGEALMAHPSYQGELEQHCMHECAGPTIYKTKKEALDARNNISMPKHLH